MSFTLWFCISFLYKTWDRCLYSFEYEHLKPKQHFLKWLSFLHCKICFSTCDKIININKKIGYMCDAISEVFVLWGLGIIWWYTGLTHSFVLQRYSWLAQGTTWGARDGSALPIVQLLWSPISEIFVLLPCCFYSCEDQTIVITM